MSRSQYQPIEVDFEYNEDGLRTKKTITDENDIVTVTEYTLHGKNIVHMKKGAHNLHFFYDGQGKPSIVEWNNGTTTTKYAYVYNLQGDVIALMNSAGTKVVEYTYDGWGKPISKTGTLASALGTLNPFRYRGYVYDEEIDFYYLRSRYYNANRGRFINADSCICFNLFSYCINAPINYFDPSGFKKVAVPIEENSLPTYVYFDVPLYNQGQTKLCWAYSQLMVEDFKSGITRNSQEADNAARQLAESVFGATKWDQGHLPTNVTDKKAQKVYLLTINDLRNALLSANGPVYAYYKNPLGLEAHIVVVKGVDTIKDLVYVNNPQGKGGTQSFLSFQSGYYGMSQSRNRVLEWIWIPD